MKIQVVTNRPDLPIAKGLTRELEKRGLYGEGDIVINLDPCVGVFTKGKKTILWEADDFLNIGEHHYDHLLEQVDVRYITHPEYLKYYPNGTRVLRPAFDGFYSYIRPSPIYDCVFANSLEPRDIYLQRINKLNEYKKTNKVTLLGSSDYKTWLDHVSRAERVLDFLPYNPKNDLYCAHDSIYAFIALSNPIFEDVEVLNHVKGLTREDILKDHTYANRVDQLLNEL